jgi:signal transduction histidine kinase
MERDSRSSSVSAARWLVGILAGVVLCFTLTSAVGEFLESTIAGRVHLIVANAMPSVEVLANARGDLRKIDFMLDRYSAASPNERPEIADAIAQKRRDVDATLASYIALPFFPRERAFFVEAVERLAIADARRADYLANPDQPRLVAVHRECEAVDQALMRIVAFDASQGQRLGLEIERIRGESRASVVLLDAISVMLAVGATLLALRQLRRAARARQAEREAERRQTAELEARNEALGEWAGRVAHDILSPLSTAILAFDVAEKTCERDPIAHRATKRGTAAIYRVKTLVEDLLAFSRAGGQPEPNTSTELARVIRDVTDGLTVQARNKDITFSIGALPDGDVACSAGVLTSLVGNLASNAIKHMGTSLDRRIEIAAFDAGPRWRVEVRDTGPGIPASEQARIFQPYVQLSRGAPGIGLGLATVDRLVRAHHGSLGVISSGRGAVFWFELPKAS